MSIPIQLNPLGINYNERKEPLSLIATQANSTIKLTAVGNPVVDGLQYSLNGGKSWSPYTIDTEIILENIGDSVEFQNTRNSLSWHDNHYVNFVMTGKIKGSGNIQSMLNYSESCISYCYRSLFENCESLIETPILPATILASGCYDKMFKGCTSLINIPKLSATILFPYCYTDMFRGCTSLVKTTELPATILALSCYHGMFANCTSLTEAPEIFAENLVNDCYAYMFWNCTSLIHSPKLHTKVLGDNCYWHMFDGCSSLIDYPELPFTELKYQCYEGMFYGCTSLTEAPELPATNLTHACYRSMFYGCTSLTEAPELPATTLTTYCYHYMFYNCSSLIEPPELSATNLADRCYEYMFAGCTSLITAPELPAIMLAPYCYAGMFENCSSLINAPELPATDLSGCYYCYSEMFYACRLLIEAPELPATTLAESCYERMFSFCNLTSSPKLPATILAKSCYENMFEKDEKMQKMDVDFENWSVNNSNISDEWVKYIFTDGVFLKPENLSEEYGYSRIPFYFISFDKDKPLTFTATTDSTIKIEKSGNPTTFNLLYKKNNGEWTQYTLNTIIDLDNGDFVQFKNITTNQFSTGNSDYYNFVMTGEIKASGNVQSLVNFSDTANSYTFRKLFQNCKSLIKAPLVLPAKHVENYAYASMFGKTSITNMPIMLAEDFGDYACYYMFEECPINYAKILDKKGINGNRCFESMFNNCSNLKIIDVDFTIWTIDSVKDEHRNWVSGISTSGTFLKKQVLNKAFATNRIPNNWNVYNPLKFIQATGTQYINTNITPSGNFEIEVCCTGCLNFGCRSDELQNEFRFSIINNQIDFAFGDDLHSYLKTGIGIDVNVIKYGTDGKFYINNELIYSSSSSVSQYYPIYAFALNSDGTPIFNISYPSRIFRIKMWRDGTLISDIIPVDNNGGCLFDKLNNICFSNNGTGNFVI